MKSRTDLQVIIKFVFACAQDKKAKTSSSAVDKKGEASSSATWHAPDRFCVLMCFEMLWVGRCGVGRVQAVIFES